VASKLSLFLAELKRRKVYHVGGAYVAAALVVATATAELHEYLRLPPWTPGFVIVLLVVGFPIALILAWAYEVKPEEPRTKEASDKETLATRDGATRIEVTDREQRKSIVVLPFDNMSPDPGDAYFADGLTEEIITNLSHIQSLRVISRNSAVALKGTEKSTRVIADELNVQYVLEGSVRKAGNDLLITAQLIDGPMIPTSGPTNTRAPSKTSSKYKGTSPGP
jgi:TolB-like protein